MRVEVKKLYRNHASVRDYLVKKAIDAKEDLVIEHEGKVMTIKWHNISKGHTDTKQQFSKFDKKVYRLVDYPWRPDKVKETNPNQVGLF